MGLRWAVGKVWFGSPGVSETNGRGGETNGGRFIARFDRGASEYGGTAGFQTEQKLLKEELLNTGREC